MAILDDVRELDCAFYEQRQREEVSLAQLEKRASELSVGGKFQFRKGRWSPIAYPGISIVSMVDDEPENLALRQTLIDLQAQMIRDLAKPSAFYPLPPDSFHQTMANTFSADRYDQHVVQRGIENGFPFLLGQAFENIDLMSVREPICMRLIGVSLFRTAIGLLGVFEKTRDFERIIQFRDQFYGYGPLAEIGLQRTRPFIGHITLAYIESELNVAEQKRVVDALHGLNVEIAKQNLTMVIRKTEARWYDHLAEFKQRWNDLNFSFVE